MTEETTDDETSPDWPTADVDGRPGARAAAVAVACLAAIAATLLALLFATSWGPLHDLDRAAAQKLNTYAVAHPLWVRMLQVWTDLFSPATFRVLALLLVLWLAHRRVWRLAAFSLVVITVGAAAQFTLKPGLGRERPTFPNPVDYSSGNAFPSGHAMTATLACGVLLLLALPHLTTPLLRTAACTVAVLVPVVTGFTRVALGVHWMSDVLAGWILGVVVVAAAGAVFEPWRPGPTRSPAELPEGKEHHR